MPPKHLVQVQTECAQAVEITLKRLEVGVDVGGVGEATRQAKRNFKKDPKDRIVKGDLIIDILYGEITTVNCCSTRPPKKQSEKKKNARALQWDGEFAGGILVYRQAVV